MIQAWPAALTALYETPSNILELSKFQLSLWQMLTTM